MLHGSILTAWDNISKPKRVSWRLVSGTDVETLLDRLPVHIWEPNPSAAPRRHSSRQQNMKLYPVIHVGNLTASFLLGIWSSNQQMGGLWLTGSVCLRQCVSDSQKKK